MADRTGVLLRNHGATTYGDTLDKAYTRSIYLEWVCKLYHQASQIGERLCGVVQSAVEPGDGRVDLGSVARGQDHRLVDVLRFHQVFG
jgi:ribulose-5-phosphate 4-epimerase/fuculose-1-phosphate aldolase